MHSISILASKGNAATWYVERAGAGEGKSTRKLKIKGNPFTPSWMVVYSLPWSLDKKALRWSNMISERQCHSRRD